MNFATSSVMDWGASDEQTFTAPAPNLGASYVVSAAKAAKTYTGDALRSLTTGGLR
jgi:hypothetical protein